MSLEAGSSIAHYRLIEQIGRGGMGIVWAAEDTRLGRQVAIKMLPLEFGADAERLARFDREARVLASLNHPNIAALYAIEEADAQRFLVMELVPGGTLEDRIVRGPVPFDETMAIARQIAVALSAAHAAGILHRDLKPANVKVTPAGVVKVLDFGLAKEMAPGGQSSASASLSPTFTAATQAGVILGTAAYMSPEQARGHSADRRADVWGFGCILYEMLSGRRPFEGHTVSDTLASVLKVEPDWTAIPATVPPSIQRLLRRTLAKDQARRLHDIADALLEIDDANENPGAAVAEPVQAGLSRRLLPWVLLAILAGASAWNAWRLTRNEPVQAGTVTASILPPAAARFDIDQGLALSPDGTQLVTVVRGQDGVRRLWLRAIDREEGALLEGTEEASIPFWSPDSRAVAFAAAGMLKKVDIATRVVESIGPCARDATGGTWGTSGQILIGASGSLRGIERIPAGGGTPVTVVPTEKAEFPMWPTFLPDGKHFLFQMRDYGGQVEQGEIRVGSIDGGPSQPLLRANSNAAYAAGLLIWWHDGNLRAQRFDADRMALAGESFAAVQMARFDPRSGYAAFTVSRSGALVYGRSTGTITNELVWLDRDGRDLSVLGPNASYYGPTLSPQGTRVATDISDQTNRGDIWLLDVARGAATRLTSWPEDDSKPVWSPTGREVAFFSLRGSPRAAVFVQPLGAPGEPRLLVRDQAAALRPTSWSRNGELLVDWFAGETRDIHVYSFSNQSMRPYLTGPFSEQSGAFSPDGRLVAFAGNETGDSEIYVASFPEAGERLRVSASGGTQAVWRRDGKELFFVSPRGELMAVSVTTGGTGPGGATIGVPRPLFRADIKEHVHTQFDTIDGERFLVNRNLDSGANHPLTLVLQPFAAKAR